jgi:hypothetical protein
VDVQLALRVLWRFKVVVATGFLLAVTAAILSFVRIDVGDGFKLSYRQNEQWESLSEVFITPEGFPWGKTFDTPSTGTSGGSTGVDPNHLNTSASLFLELGTSDPVLQRIRRSGPIHGLLRTFPVFPDGNSDFAPLPMVTLSAVAASAPVARQLNARYLNAFVYYIKQRQASAGIADRQRIQLQVLRHPSPAALLQGRKLTRPIVIFMAVMLATIALAFVLENLRPRIRPVEEKDSSTRKLQADTPSRRTA